MTVSEIVQINDNCTIQSELDNIGTWSKENDITDMRLNPDKCKEIIVSFSPSQEMPPTSEIEGKSTERVQIHKGLGLTFQSNLKWNTFIDKLISKASKRLHIFRY